MLAEKPEMILFTGANGAGKTTLRKLIEAKYHLEFPNNINADQISSALIDDMERVVDIIAKQKEEAESLMDKKGMGIYDIPDDPEDGELGKIALYKFCFELMSSQMTDKERFKELISNLSPENPKSKKKLLEYMESETPQNKRNLTDWGSYVEYYNRKYSYVDRMESFSFEDVIMSNYGLDILNEANEKGYQTSLFFLATSDPSINVQRVQKRVAEGGHGVIASEITRRYGVLMEKLPQMVEGFGMIEIWDNSTDGEIKIIARKELGKDIQFTESGKWLRDRLEGKVRISDSPLLEKSGMVL